MSESNNVRELDIFEIANGAKIGKGSCVCGRENVNLYGLVCTHLVIWRTYNGKEVTGKRVRVGEECFKSIKVAKVLEPFK